MERLLSSLFFSVALLVSTQLMAQPPNPTVNFYGIAAVTSVSAVGGTNTWDITIAGWEGGYNLSNEQFLLDSIAAGDVIFLNCTAYEVTTVFSVTAGAQASLRVVANIAAPPTVSATANAAVFRLTSVTELPFMVQAVTNPGETGLSKLDNACLLNYLVAQIAASVTLDTVSVSIEGDITVNTQYFASDGASDISSTQMGNWLDTTNVLSLTVEVSAGATDTVEVALPDAQVYKNNLIEMTIRDTVAAWPVVLDTSLVSGVVENSYEAADGERLSLISVLVDGSYYWALASSELASDGSTPAASTEGLCNLKIFQASHGFSKWDPVIARASGWELAADSTGIDGIVVDSVHVDTFSVQMCGYVEGAHSFSVGLDYYVQTDGSLSTTPDTINTWALTALESDLVQVREVRPFNPADGAGGGGSDGQGINQASNGLTLVSAPPDSSVVLGGTLTQNTTIDGDAAAYYLKITGTDTTRIESDVIEINGFDDGAASTTMKLETSNGAGEVRFIGSSGDDVVFSGQNTSGTGGSVAKIAIDGERYRWRNQYWDVAVTGINTAEPSIAGSTAAKFWLQRDADDTPEMAQMRIRDGNGGNAKIFSYRAGIGSITRAFNTDITVDSTWFWGYDNIHVWSELSAAATSSNEITIVDPDGKWLGVRVTVVSQDASASYNTTVTTVSGGSVFFDAGSFAASDTVAGGTAVEYLCTYDGTNYYWIALP